MSTVFNVCPNCGEYCVEKTILDAPTRAVCSECGHQHPFVRAPLFVVTGASGSGKTTCALNLVKLTDDFITLDQDILWSDAMNVPDDDFRMFRDTWLRMAKNINQAGRPVLLFGSAIPKQYELCPERRYFSDIQYLALVCSNDRLAERLRARPNWRRSGDDDTVKRMQEFNSWLLENAPTTEPPMAVLDTTEQNVETTSRAIYDWVASRTLR